MLKGKFTFQSFWGQKNALAFIVLVLSALMVSVAISVWGEKAFIISLALVVGIALTLASLMNERIPLYLLVSSLALAGMLRVEYIPSTLLVIPGSLAVFSLLAAIAFRKKKVSILSPVIFLTVILLGVWASIATATVGNVSESRPYWLVIILLLLIPNLLTKAEHMLRASWLFLLPLGALGIYVFMNRLVFFLTARDVSAETLHLVRFEMGDKNIVGLWLTLGMPFTFYLFGYYRTEPVKRFWLLMAGSAMLAGALATLSLGVVAGLCAMIGLIIWFQPDTSARLRSLALGIIILPLIFNGFVTERLQTRQILTPDETWGSYRGELWAAGVQTIIDHPIFGIGLNPSRRAAMLKYIDVGFVQNWYKRGVMIMPHNSIISVGVDLGLPGLVLYLLLLSLVFSSLWRLRRKLKYTDQEPMLQVFTNILLVALMVGWVQSMALSVHLDKLMWFLMGSAIALWSIVKSKEKTPQTQIV